MELDEDIALPVPPGMDVLTHRISVARLQHVSNLAWCLGSWLPHLVSLAVLLIRLVRFASSKYIILVPGRIWVYPGRHVFHFHFSIVLRPPNFVQEHSKSGGGADDGGGQSSPQVHIRKLYGPGAFAGGASDYADGDTASITTSGPRAASTAHEVMDISSEWEVGALSTTVVSPAKIAD